ncbi:hypothetical protein H7100_03110, partial [Candidatus Saccharibacteria bacterium]|nr:hypothetical protein [Candidatus Saccharibacteria bacterium]
TNVTPPFSEWTLSGGATYNGSTGEITLPTASANAYSPLMRVENASSMTVGASFYATTVAATFSPQGGFLLGTEYFAANLSPVANSAGYQNNGCARALALNSLSVMPTTCSFAGGPGVKYVRTHYSGSSTYTSTGIKIKDPSTIFSQ